MSEPTTEAGRAASKAIKSGMLGMWADDPDDPIGFMVASVEAEARATLLAELWDRVDGLERWETYDSSGKEEPWVRLDAVRVLLDQ